MIRKNKTVSIRKMGGRKRVFGNSSLYPEEINKPIKRSQCKNGIRPCPYISCKYNLYIDVMYNGSIKYNFPNIEPWEMEDSCVLDLVDEEIILNLQRIGDLLNISKEDVRQIEFKGLNKMINDEILEEFV